MALDTLEIFGTEYTNVAGIKATDDGGNTKTYIRPQGTKSISANGTGIDVAAYAEVDVAVVPASGSATTPATTITANPSISVNPSTGLISAAVAATKSVTPAVVEGWVSSGTAGNITVSGSNTSQLTTQGATTYTPGTTDQTISSGTYLTGNQTISGDANLVASNIKQGVSVFSVLGTYTGGGGGGSNWTLLASEEIAINTTSTSATKVRDIQLTLSDYADPQTVLWVHIRDKAGRRSGYFYGADTIYFHSQLAAGNNNSLSTRPSVWFRGTGNEYAIYTSTYGVYASRLYYSNSSHYVEIYARYSSSTTGTINGTFKCDVYKLTMPTGMTLFQT